MKGNGVISILAILASLSMTFGAVKQNTSPQKSSWKAELEVLALNFDHHVSQTKLIYQVYQNPVGVIRHELIKADPPLGTVVGIGRDVQIIDYRNGTLVAFDKGRPMAVRYPLKEIERDPFSARSTPLGTMRILRYQCKGVENRSSDPQNNVTEIRQT